MIVITILLGLDLLGSGSVPLWIAGIAAWAAALLLFPDTSRVLKIQVSLILLIGIAMIAYALRQSAAIDLDALVSANTGLMTMIASVGFLRLVVIPETLQEETLPVGRKAFLQTILGLNISSSVINISAPILVCDRIHRQRPIQRFSAQTFTRVFCGVSSWSPFFGAMAVVLTYVSDASLSWIIVAGFPFMLIGFIGVYLEARIRFTDEVENFVGYPTHLKRPQGSGNPDRHRGGVVTTTSRNFYPGFDCDQRAHGDVVCAGYATWSGWFFHPSASLCRQCGYPESSTNYACSLRPEYSPGASRP